MFIEALELKNYRNYETLNLEVKNGTNILYGDNAQGKTNILEAVYVACTSKSHRGSKDREIIRFNQDEGHIKLIINKNNVPCRIDIHLKSNGKSKGKKGIAVNGIPIKKVSELFGVGNVIIFSPEDLSLIKDGPAERRKFIDMELCQIDKIYAYNVISYNKILNQRNKLLKDIKISSSKETQGLYDTLDVWDIKLAEFGVKITESRQKFIKDINDIIIDIHAGITDGKERLRLKYEPSLNIYEKDICAELLKNRNGDLYTGSTSIGPHRDDISFYNGNIDLRKYGSQGQQRTAALSLKLAEIELVKKIINDVPILLLDDVLSELDSGRQKKLLSEIRNMQTIITCTGLDEFIENRFNIDNIYRVVNGKIEHGNGVRNGDYYG